MLEVCVHALWLLVASRDDNSNTIVTLRASEAVAQCIVTGPVCGVCARLWVCYHDNSKLRASILTELGL